MSDDAAQRAKRIEDMKEKKRRVEEMRRLRTEREAATTNPIMSLPNQEDLGTDSKNPLEFTQPQIVIEEKEMKVSSEVNIENIPHSKDDETINNIIKVDNSLFTSLPESFSNDISPVLPASTSSLRPIETGKVEVYDKECQTEVDETDIAKNTEDVQYTKEYSNALEGVTATELQSGEGSMSRQESGSRSSTEIFAPLPSLTEEEKASILVDNNFLSFVNQSTKVVERVLHTHTAGTGDDFIIDYRNPTTLSSGSNDDDVNVKSHNDVSVIAFSGCDASNDRPVMHIQINSYSPELYLVAYGAKGGSAAGCRLSDIHTLPSLNNVDIKIQGRGASSASVNSSEACNAEGLVCVWNFNLPTRPEFTFIAPSPVTVANFHPTQSHYILGACHSGHIVLWDIREENPHPEKISGIGPKSKNRACHHEPVYSFLFTGLDIHTSFSTSTKILGKNDVDNEIISASVDGTICYWNMTTLEEGPMNVSFLKNDGITKDSKGSSVLDDNIHVGVSSMAKIQAATGEEILFGSCIGDLYRTYRTSIIDAHPSIETNKQFLHVKGAHIGMITSIHVHPDIGSGGHKKVFRNLILTSSLDWAVKLWKLPSRMENNTGTCTCIDIGIGIGVDSTNTSGNNTNSPMQPLLEFRTADYEYVCDVQWCPTNPSVFGYITSGGKVIIWNIARSTIEPITNVNVISLLSSKQNVNNNIGALNKFIWTKDGNKLLLGFSYGATYVLRLDKSDSTSMMFQEGDDDLVELAIMKDKEGVVPRQSDGDTHDISSDDDDT
jgi:hypothetical protein